MPNDDRPSKRSRPRTIAIIASWAASSASRVVAGDAAADRVDAVVVAAQQLVERAAVAGLGGGDQLPGRRSSWRAIESAVRASSRRLERDLAEPAAVRVVLGAAVVAAELA